MSALSRHSLCTAVAAVALCAVATTAALAQDAAAQQSSNPGKRLTVQSLTPGATLDQMPAWIEFRNYACGSNGGPPLRKLSGWADFKQCKPDENGLYEVYFEYDNEAEYILRAYDNPNAARFVGTTEQGFPIVASALFSDDGVLRGVRMVTDPRADYTQDQFFELENLRSRDDFYLMGPFVGGQVGIDPARHCTSLPLAEGESKVGNKYVKLDCELVKDGLHYILKTRYYRKPGQYARDPQSGAMTVGQFESSTVFEEYQVGYGPSSATAAPADGAAASGAAQKG